MQFVSRRTLGSAFFCILVLPAVAFARGSELLDRFFSEAPRGWEFIEKWESRSELRGKLTARSKLPGAVIEKPLPNEAMTILYRRRGSSALVEAEIANGVLRVFGLNPRYAFSLSGRNTNSKTEEVQARWRVTSLISPLPPLAEAPVMVTASDQSDDIRAQIAGRYGFYVSPSISYSSLGLLKNLIKHSDFQVATAELVKTSEGDRVRVNCSIRIQSQPKEIIEKGYLVFDPSNHWAVTETEFSGNGVALHRSVTYVRDAIADYKPFDKVVALASGPGGSRVEDFVVADFLLKDIPEDAFTLKAYGLADVAIPASPERPYLIVISLIVASTICGFVAFCLRRKKRTPSIPS